MKESNDGFSCRVRVLVGVQPNWIHGRMCWSVFTPDSPVIPYHTTPNHLFPSDEVHNRLLCWTRPPEVSRFA